MITLTTEQAQQIEEALEEVRFAAIERCDSVIPSCDKALATIRAAISQEQGPVAANCPKCKSEISHWSWCPDFVQPVSQKQEPVAFKFPREPKPENAMGWTIDYGLIRQIAEDIGDQEFHPGYEGIELTLMALEHIYTAQVPDRLAAAAHDLLKELQECRDLLKCVETCSRNNFENLADERVQAINAAIAAFKEKNK